ncbi:MAG: 50S ribosomal protein L16 [Candidatus Buchananbacteria bacterium CG10_big_fil_rev_8_21_14_0_10_42_9]|uniref:Large ribosomal subunit protein uL16 n=1 Tax=Candidatus Buchananbacteria bacterium CG10_big_fil_rev_8_21_14_0_10_42_9 TaxID=1974526 RepID=A0A2H0W214_9BACT|nr:MAG: 50S ribosomal protein L16 [Candidatus Buchananbacteria bacterium CG10_big_fil_rev_8_21_14_0_10_42_9]
MLAPKKTKHRKSFKGRKRFSGSAQAGTTVSFGRYAIKSLDNAWIDSRQIEAARKSMAHYIKRGGKIWIRIFPDRAITSKGTQASMGSGKGVLDRYVIEVKPGTVLFEMDGVDADKAREAMRLAGHKLPVRTKFVSR